MFDHSLTDINKLQLSMDVTFYVTCPLRYSRMIHDAIEIIERERVISARSITSSYFYLIGAPVQIIGIPIARIGL